MEESRQAQGKSSIVAIIPPHYIHSFTLYLHTRIPSDVASIISVADVGRGAGGGYNRWLQHMVGATGFDHPRHDGAQGPPAIPSSPEHSTPLSYYRKEYLINIIITYIFIIIRFRLFET